MLIDSSAVIALHDPSESLHNTAKHFFNNEKAICWRALNVTSHESFTRLRYKKDLCTALAGYEFLRTIRLLTFSLQDELDAQRLLEKYDDQTLSFHDALCAAVMLREGIYKVFTFDADFWIFGFQVLPGITQ